MDDEVSIVHPALARPVEPLVEKNSFRRQKQQKRTLPSFAEARAKLPVPVLPGHPELVEMYWRAWEIAWGHVRRPHQGSALVDIYAASARGDHLDMGDSAFIVHFSAYGRRALPLVFLLNNFYARQHADGFICRELDGLDGSDRYYPFDPDSAGPMTLAWAEWRHYRISGEGDRITAVFWPIMAYHRWCRANRTWPGGLYWTTGLSSGMDNQPRVPGGERHHRHWSWVDASMQAALDCLILERMASQLAEQSLIEELAAERLSLRRQINQRLWNGATEFYQDLSPQGEFSPACSVAAYWGLLDTELIPQERLDPFVQHLRQKGVFNTAHRVPSLSADSPGYDGSTGNGWHGAVWPTTNFMLIKGLHAVGQHGLAFEIALNHLRNLSAVFQHTDTFWQNYAPETAAPGSAAAPNALTTSGLSPVTMLLEDVIGLWINWPLRRVVWDRYLDADEPYGVENYPLGPEGTLDIKGDREKIIVSTDVPFTLTIRDRSMNMQVPLAAGITEISLT